MQKWLIMFQKARESKSNATSHVFTSVHTAVLITQVQQSWVQQILLSEVSVDVLAYINITAVYFVSFKCLFRMWSFFPGFKDTTPTYLPNCRVSVEIFWRQMLRNVVI